MIKANVARLADSIRQIGLINAISVRAVVRHRGTTPFDAYEIVAGHHRYAAALSLKWRTVRCEVVTLEILQAEMAEIDENLIRSDLTAAQAASAIARRKAIYETLHPETKAGTAQARGMNTALRRGNVTADSAATFTTATAKATGKGERTIRLIAARGAALGDDLTDIAGTCLDRTAEMDALAKLPVDERKELIRRAKAGEKVSARTIVKVADDPLPDHLAAEKQVARLMDAWNAAGPDARQEFLLRIDQPVMDRRCA